MDLQALSLGCKDILVAMRVEWIHSEYEIIVTEVYRPVNTIMVVLAMLTTPLSYTGDPEVRDVRIEDRCHKKRKLGGFKVFPPPPPSKGRFMRWPRGT